MEGSEPKVHHQRGRRPHHPFGGAYMKDDEVAARPGCQAPRPLPNPENTSTPSSAFMGRRYDDGGRREEARCRTRSRAAQTIWPVRPRSTASSLRHRGLRQGPPEAQARRRELPWRSQRGGHHRACVFQRRAAAGHEGRRRIAGLEVKRIVNEPTAAALAYGMDKKKDGGHCGLRLRRGHLRHLHPRGRGRTWSRSCRRHGDTHLARTTSTTAS